MVNKPRDVEIDFVNLNYEFNEFQQQYIRICKDLTNIKFKDMVKIKSNFLKKINPFIYPYLNYVSSDEVKKQFLEKIENIKYIKKYSKLLSKQNITINDKLNIYDLYFKIIKYIFKIIGDFADELTISFMPGKSDRKKMLPYSNNNPFFDYFTKYKSSITRDLEEFDVRNWNKHISKLMGFYYAYYPYIDVGSRIEIEDLFQDIINLLLIENIFKVIKKETSNLNSNEKILIKEIDEQVHRSLNIIFSRCTLSFSQFGVMPKIRKKKYFDTTLI